MVLSSSCYSGWLERALGSKLYAVTPEEAHLPSELCENSLSGSNFVHREFGRRQVNPALQLIDTSTSPPCEPCHCARAVRGACSFDYIELRPPSGTLSTFSPGILPPAGKSRLPNSNQRGSYEPHELLSSSRTRRAAALNSSAERHTKAKTALHTQSSASPASPAVQLVDGAPRSGAYSFEYIEIVPASETSVIHGGFCRRQAKAAPPNSKRRHHELRCSSRRRECAEYIDFHLPSKVSVYSSRTSNLTQVEFPAFSGIRFFAVRRATLVKWTNQSSVSQSPPAPFLQGQHQNWKFEISASAERQFHAGTCSGTVTIQFLRLPTHRLHSNEAQVFNLRKLDGFQSFGSHTSNQIKQLISISAQINFKFKT
ncbi:hypothetical protein R3P38DRAFT_2795913 [Favolaschia claudopus]|uniref:Uncharacterized protein n=1 Tax=Favolaschia claudopus TaxID=2862362 RepID=A0AAW0A667_9AGAR